MDDKYRIEMAEHAWQYFTLHAEQRLRTFHFFVILCAVIIGGLATCVNSAEDCRIGAVISLFLSFFSYIFFKLDQRNKQLIKHGEEALKFLDSQYELHDENDTPHVLKIFSSEEYITQKLKSDKQQFVLNKLYTYSTCFNTVFAMFGLSGIIMSLLFLFYG